VADLAGLKVCFVAGTLGQGGAERQLFYIVKALVEHGARPRVLCLTRGEFWEARIAALGVSVEWIGASTSKLRRLRDTIAAVRADRPDVVQSQHFYTNLYVVGAARALGLREIGAVRNNTTWEVGQLGALGRLSLRGPRIVAANSRVAIDNAIRLGMPAGRLRFLPNVVDTDHFSGTPAATGGAVHVLGVGRQAEQKRFDRFLSVFAEARRRARRPLNAMLVTTGTAQRDALRDRAADLGLQNGAVEFREAVADTAPLYRRADIYLLTSDWEGTPNVVLEAMASGMAVVATRVGGVPDLVRHGETGCLADPADEPALIESIVALAEDEHARAAMGGRARDFIQANHSVAALPSALRDLYRDL